MLLQAAASYYPYTVSAQPTCFDRYIAKLGPGSHPNRFLHLLTISISAANSASDTLGLSLITAETAPAACLDAVWILLMTQRILTLLTLPFLLLVTSDASAGVYKCEMNDGRITYSDKPCMDGKSSEMRVQSHSGSSTAASRSTSTPASPPSDGNLDCATSVSNGQDWIKSMREVGQRNLDTGHMSREEYNNGMKQIDEMAGHITAGNCQGSSGSTRRFFECLGNITNHLARCVQRHKPDF